MLGLTKYEDSNACYHSYLWNAQPKKAHPGDKLRKSHGFSWSNMARSFMER